MSFTNEITEELLRLPLKKTCCRKALALGMAMAARKAEEDWVLYLYDPKVAELAERLLNQIFQHIIDINNFFRLHLLRLSCTDKFMQCPFYH